MQAIAQVDLRGAITGTLAAHFDSARIFPTAGTVEHLVGGLVDAVRARHRKEAPMTPAKVVVDGRAATVVREPWADEDPKRRLQDAQCVGRCRVYFEDGTWVNAFLMASTETKTLGNTFAMFFTWTDELGGRASVVECVDLEVHDG